MAKLTVLAALFIALFAGASAYTTTVTTTIVEEKNPRSESCQTEIREEQQMTQCRQWMQKAGKPYDTAAFLRSAVANPRQGGDEYLEACCAELWKFSPECRCPVLEKMMEMMQQQYGRDEEERIMKMAESMPSRCQMTSPSRCSFRSPFY